MSKFRVALASDFRKEDGAPTFPDFDLTPLLNEPNVEVEYLDVHNRMLSGGFDSSIPLQAEQLEEFDALILLVHKFEPISVPKNKRLAIVARFGVGYDTVNVNACTCIVVLNVVVKWERDLVDPIQTPRRGTGITRGAAPAQTGA